MGTGTFFSKVASIDPLAHALHLPGANKYAQQQAQDANSTGAVGPYAGVTPTLAGSNAGYAPGGPGSNPEYVPFSAKRPGGAFGFAQRFSSAVGDTTPSPDAALSGKLALPSSPGGIAQSYHTGQPAGVADPYAPTAPGNPGAQAALHPYAAATQRVGTQPVNMNNVWGKTYGY